MGDPPPTGTAPIETAIGEAALVWTVRGALALFTAGLALSSSRAGARCWAAGAAAMATHVAVAFHVRHGWSHAAAAAATAADTDRLVGLNWGGGVWANHLFLAVWAADAAVRLLAPSRYANRPRWLAVGTVGFLGFVAVNGAVVFADGPTRWAGVACCGLLAGLAWRRRTGPPPPAAGRRAVAGPPDGPARSRLFPAPADRTPPRCPP